MRLVNKNQKTVFESKKNTSTDRMLVLNNLMII